VTAPPGVTVGVRGPFGSSWDVTDGKGGDVVIVTGGIGLAPLRPGGSWLVLKVLPLLLPLRGMLHGSRYASKWLTLLVMIYFTEGVVRSVTERELSQWLAMAETAMACALFVTAIVHVRSTRKALPAA
jgi:uncharacterized membrane protein